MHIRVDRLDRLSRITSVAPPRKRTLYPTEQEKKLPRYLLTEHHCSRLDQITDVQVRGWFDALAQMSTAIGTFRSPNTIESYARSDIFLLQEF